MDESKTFKEGYNHQQLICNLTSATDSEIVCCETGEVAKDYSEDSAVEQRSHEESVDDIVVEGVVYCH